MNASIVFCFVLTSVSMAEDVEQVVQALKQRVTQVKSIPLGLEYALSTRYYFHADEVGERLPGEKVVLNNLNPAVKDRRTTRPYEKVVYFDEENGLPFEESYSYCVLFTSGTAYALEKSYMVEATVVHPFDRKTSNSSYTLRTIKVAHDGTHTRTLVDSLGLASDSRTLRGEISEGRQVAWLMDLFIPQMAYNIYGTSRTLSLRNDGQEIVLEIGSHTRFRSNPLNNYMLTSKEYSGQVIKLDGVTQVNGIALPVRYSSSTSRNGNLRIRVESEDIKYRLASPEEFSRAISLEFPPGTQIVESAMGRQWIQPY